MSLHGRNSFWRNEAKILTNERYQELLDTSIFLILVRLSRMLVRKSKIKVLNFTIMVRPKQELVRNYRKKVRLWKISL